jgi:hypothetical protein
MKCIQQIHGKTACKGPCLGGGTIGLEGENGPTEVDVFSPYTGYERQKGFRTINQIPMENQFRIEHPDFHLSTLITFLLLTPARSQSAEQGFPLYAQWLVTQK